MTYELDCTLPDELMKQVLRELVEACDSLIVDSHPTLPVADTAILAPKVNGCLLVVQTGKTKRAALVEAAATLQVTNTKLCGVVLNQVKKGAGSDYGSYYHDSAQEAPVNGGELVGQGALGNIAVRGRALWKARARRVRQGQ